MLVPKRVKHRKWQRGCTRPMAVDSRGLSLAYGNFGIKALSRGWITSRQIEAARRTITNHIKREGRVWIRIFPDKPMTARPPEVTMGGGSGNAAYYVCPVLPGRVLFEMDGVPEAIAREALRLAGFKLPVRTTILTK